MKEREKAILGTAIVAAIFFAVLHYSEKTNHSIEAAPTPHPMLTPIPGFLDNPLESEAEKQEKAMRRGIVLEDKGQVFLRIHRKDDHQITEGLTADNIVIESTINPIVTNNSGKTWEVVFTPFEVPSPTPGGK